MSARGMVPLLVAAAAAISAAATSVSGGVDAGKAELGPGFGNYDNMMAMGLFLRHTVFNTTT